MLPLIEAELAPQFARCASEAERAFGDGRLLLERALRRPRHVEVQLAADGAGRVVHFGERDCSVQSRHQKLVELCPAPALTDATRAALHARATRLGRELAGAGLRCLATVEFLLDTDADGGGDADGGDDGVFFLEINPRLQVEHPITELVTGVDLVALQLRLAAGASLAELGFAAQEDVRFAGAAVSARVSATTSGRA